jgi:hypothetical protein
MVISTANFHPTLLVAAVTLNGAIANTAVIRPALPERLKPTYWRPS